MSNTKPYMYQRTNYNKKLKPHILRVLIITEEISKRKQVVVYNNELLLIPRIEFMSKQILQIDRKDYNMVTR